MAVSNSRRTQAPFLTYLTVFKARFGAVNIVVSLATLAYQPAVTLLKRLKEQLSRTVLIAVSDRQADALFQYLSEKGFVGSRVRTSGRYKDYALLRRDERWIVRDRSGGLLQSIEVAQTDLWMADEHVPSTVGVPTPENAQESLDFAIQIGVISSAKNSLTASGQLIKGLQQRTVGFNGNPMVLGLEAPAYLRQLLEVDGVLLREVLRYASKSVDSFSRDFVAKGFEEIVSNALTAAKDLNYPPPSMSSGRKFLKLIQRTSQRRDEMSTAPGVLEHRVAPRLEWLTDVGALSKAGRKRNTFEYSYTSDGSLLLDLLDRSLGAGLWADSVSLQYWYRASCWQNIRSAVSSPDVRSALAQGYEIMKRVVGPTSIREVVFAAGIIGHNMSLSLPELNNAVIEWASSDPGVTISGGRYRREPELVHIAPEILKDEAKHG